LKDRGSEEEKRDGMKEGCRKSGPATDLEKKGKKKSSNAMALVTAAVKISGSDGRGRKTI